MDKLTALLDAGKPILLDGAMGTMLFDAGLDSGDSPEEWNVTNPEKVQAIHQAYVKAGSQIILTNTFGGSTVRLESHGLGNRTVELNQAAAQNARAVADQADHTVLVGGSIGPSGEILEPLGTLSLANAKSGFAAQTEGLAKGGVDLFWIETMSDLEEVKAAIAGVRSVSDLPIAATMSFDSHGRTMMGISPEQAASVLQGEGVQMIGANCGTGSDELIEAIQAIQAAGPSVPVIAKANAGIPEMVGTEVVYNGSPEVMAAYALEVWKQGAKLIGGCCGSTPAHIQAMATALSKV